MITRIESGQPNSRTRISYAQLDELVSIPTRHRARLVDGPACGGAAAAWFADGGGAAYGLREETVRRPLYSSESSVALLGADCVKAATDSSGIDGKVDADPIELQRARAW